MGVRDLCLSSINHGILAKEAIHTSYAKYFTYVYCHMKVYLTDRSLCKDEYILAHVVGEEYAVFLPKQIKIEEESAAKLHFASVVRSALKSVKASNPDYTACFPQGLTYESYEQNQEFEIGYKEVPELKRYPDPFKNPADFRAKVSLLLEFNNKKADVGALFDVAYDIVLMLALMMVPIRVNLPKEVLFLTFVTFAKKGRASEEYIKKVETVIQEELQLTIKLNENIIERLWKYYEPQMSAEMMEHCVKLTLAELPEESTRLRNLVELCKWHGLTCYQAVKQALDLPGFPWDRLTKLTEYQTEMKAYEEAARLVGDNAFYGYNPSMGKAKSIHYKNLASVCARILVETRKSPALDKAACFTKSYQSKDIVDGIITEYVRQAKVASSRKPRAGQPGGTASKTAGSKPTETGTIAAKLSTSADIPNHGAKLADAQQSVGTKMPHSDAPLHKPKPQVISVKPDSDDEPSWPDEFDYDFDDEPSWPDMVRDFDDPCDLPDRIADLCGDIQYDTPDYLDLHDNHPPDSPDYYDRFDGDDTPDYFDQYDDFGDGDYD